VDYSFEDFKIEQYNKFGVILFSLAQNILRNRKMKYMLEKIIPKSIRKFEPKWLTILVLLNHTNGPLMIYIKKLN